MRVRLFAAALTGLCLAAAVQADAPAQAQPRRQPPRIIFYGDSHYRGDQRSVDGDVRNFRSLHFNDKVSSVRVLSGSWQVCEDSDFRGRCMTLRADTPSLAPVGFNDRISSVRLLADAHPSEVRPADIRPAGNNVRGGRDDGITLFSDIDFRGERRVVDGTMRDFATIGFNDVVSSIRIRSGSWQFCDNANFRGRCMTFSADVRTLVDYGFNDRISSARRLR